MRLRKYSQSKINKISIVYGDEKIQFNLWDELKISEENLERELKNQPSYYAFILSLHKKLLTEFELAKVEKKRMYGHLFLLAKEDTVNGRPLNDEMCKASVESNKRYIKACQKCIKIKNDADILFSAVKGFEQRKDNLQTLSANKRKEF